MVFRATKLDYIVTLIMMIAFLLAFFLFSDTIGIYQPTYEDKTYTINMFVIIGPIILIYEMFQLYVLPGKRQGRELPWRLYTMILKEKIMNKINSGIQEYKAWKEK